MKDYDMQLTQVAALLKAAVQQLSAIEVTVDFERPKQCDFGDAASSVALVTFSRLTAESKAQLGVNSPLVLAQLIVKSIDKKALSCLGIEKIEAVAPGFINLTWQDRIKWTSILNLLEAKAGRYVDLGRDQTVVIDYSSPNIAKPFTIGHLRSTIIGDSVANLLSASGYRVVRDNHLGDWGTQFGKQIVAIKRWGDLDKISASQTPVKELVDLYVRFHEEVENDPSLNDEARAVFKQLEDGDPEVRAIWQRCVDLSMVEFNKIYARLGVSPFDITLGESFAEPYVPEVVKILEKKGLLQDSKGAKVVFFPEQSKLPPMIVIKDDGATIYATRDLAIDHYKLQNYGQDIIEITEVGAEQNLYFRQLIATEEALGWFKSGKRLHLSHGLYRFKDRKMSTRKGDVIWLSDILDEAHRLVKKMSKADLSHESIEAIAIGAIKWNDLSREANKNIDFDFTEILNVKGFSGPYVQYSLVRALAILQKITASQMESVQEILTLATEVLSKKSIQNLAEIKLDDDERELVGLLTNYYQTIVRATSNYAPHLICDYLYNVATSFNSFYARGVILSDVKREVLTAATAWVLEKGLAILGIKSLVKM